MSLYLPPSPNWYCAQIVDCHKKRGILAYGSRNDVVLIKLLLKDDKARSVSLGSLRTLWVHHNVRITAVRFCPFASHDTLLASVGDDQMLCVLDCETEDVVYRHSAHAGVISCLAWVRLNDHAVCVVSGDDTGRLVVANVASRKTRSYSPINKAVTSLAACPHAPGLVVAGYRDGTVVVLDLHADEADLVLLRRKIHSQDVHSVCWAPFKGSGPLTSGSGGDPTELRVATGSRDGTIRIWNTRTGEVSRTFTIPLNVRGRSQRAFDDRRGKLVAALYWPEHQPEILFSSSHSGAFLRWNLRHGTGNGDKERTDDKNTIATATEVKAINESDREADHVIDETGSKIINGSEGAASKIAVHHAGSGVKALPYVVVGLKQADGKQHSSSIFSIAGFGTHGAVTVSMDRQIMFWDVSVDPDQSWILSVPTLGGYIYQILFSPFNSGLLAVGCGDQTIKTWNLTTVADPYDVVSMWQGIRSHIMSISWHPRKEALLAYGTKDGRVGLYDVLGNKPLGDGTHSRFLKKTANVYVVCWGPPLTGDEDPSSLRIYSCGGGIVSIHDPRQLDRPSTDIDRILRPNVQAKPGASRYSDVTWNDPGTVLALGDDDGIVRLYSRPGLRLLASVECRGKQVRSMRWHPEYTLSSTEASKYRHWMAFSTKGSRLYVHNFAPDLDASKRGGGTVRCDLELTDHTEEVPQLCWNPHLDGQLVSASYDGTVRLWDAPAGRVLACYSGHTAKVFTCAWSPLDPDVVFSGGTDFSVHMWRVSQQPKDVTAEAMKRRAQLKERLIGTANKETKKVTRSPSIPAATANVSAVAAAAEAKVPAKSGVIDIAELIEQRKREILARGDRVVTVLSPSVEPSVPKTVDPVGNVDLDDKNDFPSGTTDKLDVIVKNSVFGKSSKKNKKGHSQLRSIFPTTNQLDNSCGKVANLEDCVLLASRPTGTGSSGSKVEFGCGAHTHLGLYGNRVDTYRLLKTEADKHAATDNLDYALQLEVWKGNVAGALKIAMESEQLSDWLVGLAAAVSPTRYAEVCGFYAKQLVRAGNPRKAVLYLLATDKVHEAIEVLKKHVSLMEAVILAKVRLSQKDPLIAQLLEERGDQLAGIGQVEVAAKCFLGSGNPAKAATLLCHKEDAAGLRVSAVIAQKSGDSQKASAYAKQAVCVSLVTQDFETATIVIKEHPSLKCCSLVFAVHRHIIGQWLTSDSPGGENSVRYEPKVGTSALFATIRRNWDSEGVLGADECSEDILTEHLNVIQQTLLPMKHGSEVMILAFLSTCLSLSAVYAALGNSLAALGKILDCYVVIHHSSVKGMLSWWNSLLEIELNDETKWQLHSADCNDSIRHSLRAFLALSKLQRLHDDEDEALEHRAPERGEPSVSTTESCPACVESSETVASLSEILLDSDRGELGWLTGRSALIKVALAGALARRKSGILAAASVNSSSGSAVSDGDGASGPPSDVPDNRPTALDVSAFSMDKLTERAADISVEDWQRELRRVDEKIVTLEENTKVQDFPDVLTSARLLVELCDAKRVACVGGSSGCESLLAVRLAAARFGLLHSVHPNDVNRFKTDTEVAPSAPTADVE